MSSLQYDSDDSDDEHRLTALKAYQMLEDLGVPSKPVTSETDLDVDDTRTSLGSIGFFISTPAGDRYISTSASIVDDGTASMDEITDEIDTTIVSEQYRLPEAYDPAQRIFNMDNVDELVDYINRPLMVQTDDGHRIATGGGVNIFLDDDLQQGTIDALAQSAVVAQVQVNRARNASKKPRTVLRSSAYIPQPVVVTRPKARNMMDMILEFQPMTSRPKRTYGLPGETKASLHVVRKPEDMLLVHKFTLANFEIWTDSKSRSVRNNAEVYNRAYLSLEPLEEMDEFVADSERIWTAEEKQYARSMFYRYIGRIKAIIQDLYLATDAQYLTPEIAQELARLQMSIFRTIAVDNELAMEVPKLMDVENSIIHRIQTSINPQSSSSSSSSTFYV